MGSHQLLMAVLVPDKKLNHFYPIKKIYHQRKTIKLIIRDQYRHLVVMVPHSFFRLPHLFRLFREMFEGHRDRLHRNIGAPVERRVSRHPADFRRKKIVTEVVFVEVGLSNCSQFATDYKVHIN